MGLTTSPNGIRYPVGGDSASLVATYYKNLADDVQANLTVYSDTEPTKKPGLMWWAPTAGTLKITDGSSWTQLLADTGWQTITLKSGFVLNTVQPAYRVKNDIVHFRGDVKPSSGTFALNSGIAITDPGAIPAGALPIAQDASESTIGGNNADLAVRAFVSATGYIQIGTGADATAWVSLKGLSGYLAEA